MRRGPEEQLERAFAATASASNFPMAARLRRQLTLMSHEKSMGKERARVVQEQIRERSAQIEQQGEVKDVHAQATKRSTFDETYKRQMDALEKKIGRL